MVAISGTTGLAETPVERLCFAERLTLWFMAWGKLAVNKVVWRPRLKEFQGEESHGVTVDGARPPGSRVLIYENRDIHGRTVDRHMESCYASMVRRHISRTEASADYIYLCCFVL
jgi:hypothetical protein